MATNVINLATNKWGKRFVFASYTKRDFSLQLISRSRFFFAFTQNKIFGCSFFGLRFFVAFYLESSLGHIPHEIYGLE